MSLTFAQFNLGWKLALVIKGLAPISLMETYTQERIPVIAAMIDKTTELLKHTMAMRDDPTSKAVAMSFRRNTELNMLGVNYRGSPIVLEERTQKAESEVYQAYGDNSANAEIILQAGDRAPDAPDLRVFSDGEKTTLYDIFGSTYHTVLLFGSFINSDGVNGIKEILSKYPPDLFRVVAVYAKGVENKKLEVSGILEVEDTEGYAAQSYLLPEQTSGQMA